MCEKKKFTMIDENFICEVCGREVLKLNYTARDHCNHCLSSKHLDINPGDRAASCGGVLEPISIEKGAKDKYKIVYKCTKCGMTKKNIMATDDNFDVVLEIMKKSSI
jgi:DNA-directed RNA polymerase subunit RPC12/RpoP